MFFWMIYLTECGGGRGTKTKHSAKNSKIIVQKIYDSVPVISQIYVPKYIEKTVYIQQPQDTIYIVQDYNTVRIQRDTLIDDSTAYIMVYDSISQNKIQARQWVYKDRTPTSIIYTEQCSRWNIGIGGNLRGNLNEFDYGLGLLITTNNRATYALQYNFGSKSVGVGYYWNFRK